MSNTKPSTDYKTIGISGVSGAGLVALIMNFQAQGIDLINKNNMQGQEIARIQSLNNSKRLDKVETSIEKINEKLDKGFLDIRTQLSSDITTINNTLRLMTADRYTKTEHNAFADSIHLKLQRMDDRLREVESRKK